MSLLEEARKEVEAERERRLVTAQTIAVVLAGRDEQLWAPSFRRRVSWAFEVAGFYCVVGLTWLLGKLFDKGLADDAWRLHAAFVLGRKMRKDRQ